jgi:hypothetical protein
LATSPERPGDLAPKVALATCAELPELDEDGLVLVAALAQVGLGARIAVWDDPAVDWDSFDLVIIRGTWDYILRHQEFITWTRRVSELANPADILGWNTDKHYLADLAASGVQIIPTRFVEPSEETKMVDLPDGEVVVKPTVSAGSMDTSLYGPHQHDLALAHIREIQTSGRTAMVQPYRDSVDDTAETGLIYLGGTFSHAIRKEPLLRDEPISSPDLFREHVVSARTATSIELDVAETVLDAVPGGRDRLLYARVDMVSGPDGPELMELELTEPALYLNLAEGSGERFAQAILQRLECSLQPNM